jgi:hypothetical protein
MILKCAITSTLLIAPTLRAQATTTRHEALLGCYELRDSSNTRADSTWYNGVGLIRLRPDSAAGALPAGRRIQLLMSARKGRWRADPQNQFDGGPAWHLDTRVDSLYLDFLDGLVAS